MDAALLGLIALFLLLIYVCLERCAKSLERLARVAEMRSNFYEHFK